MLYSLVMVIHILVCFVLCVVVLLQSSKGGGLAGAFGGGGGAPQQIFGSKGVTTILHKVTIYCAVGFFVTSSLLFLLTGTRNNSDESLGDLLRDTGVSDVMPPITAPLGDDAMMPVPTEGGAVPDASTTGAGGETTDTPEGAAGGTEPEDDGSSGQ